MDKDVSKKDIDVYREIVLAQVPRILGLGDRSQGGATSGCFDRYYWHYRITDFPNARFQEAALLLALLYKYEFEKNIYHGRKAVLEWLKAAAAFWVKIQHCNGSFDEVYPNENSFIATAFSAYAVTQASLETGRDIISVKKLKKTGDWLAVNNNFDVSNQMAASASALHNIFLITGAEKYKSAAREKIAKILALQAEDGYYPEYGGCDVGYMSICMGYLAAYYKREKTEKLKQSLEKALNCVSGRIDARGHYNWREMSRKTQYIYPYGFATMGSDIISRHVKGLSENSIVSPAWMDDRFCLPLTVDYLRAYLGC